MIDKIFRRLVLAAVLGAVVFAAFGFYADLSELHKSLARFDWWFLPPALALVVASYALRFVRWEYYLRRVGVALARGESASIFLSGFVMSVTPGKFGEVFKSFLLREAHGAAIARTAPIVVAERLTDLISLVFLCAAGILTFDYGAVVVGVCAALCAVVVVLISSRRLAHACIELTGRVPGVRRLSDKLHEMYDSMADLVRPAPLGVASALGVLAWLAECAGVYLLCLGVGPDAAGVSFTLATFIHGFATIFGAITMLPGGIGATEGSMTGLLVLLGKLPQAPAIALTLLVRVCTLWFGVGVGVTALALRRRRGTAAVGRGRPAVESARRPG